MRHFVGCEGITDQELRPSPLLTPKVDTEWDSDGEEFAIAENNLRPVSVCMGFANALNSKGQRAETCDLLSTRSLDAAESATPSQIVGYPGADDPQCNSPSSASTFQESKWSIRVVDSDLALKGRRPQTSVPQGINANPIPYDAFLRLTEDSPNQSEGTALTSWDEWDEPSNSLEIDAIHLITELRSNRSVLPI